MNLCSHTHDEVCFEGSRCPACEIIEDKDREINRLQRENDNLEDNVRSLQNENDNLESQLIESQLNRV